MDLTSAIVGLSQAKVMGQVQMRVAEKILDNERLQGASALKLLQAASDGVNKAGDELVAQSIGLGGELDVYG